MPKRLYTHLSAEDRETVSLGLAQGQSLRRLAPSTLSREHVRNARDHPYRACTAQRLAAARARQPAFLIEQIWRHEPRRHWFGAGERCGQPREERFEERGVSSLEYIGNDAR